MAIGLSEAGFFAHRPIWFMINGGVFDRHPGLKIVFVESGALWAHQGLSLSDFTWEYTPGARATKRRPSEHYREHIFFGVSNPLSKAEIEARHEIGLHQIMLGGDHPHWGSPWGCTTEWLRLSLGTSEVPESEARMMFGENAASLYGLDVARLDEVANRIGTKGS